MENSTETLFSMICFSKNDIYYNFILSLFSSSIDAISSKKKTDTPDGYFHWLNAIRLDIYGIVKIMESSKDKKIPPLIMDYVKQIENTLEDDLGNIEHVGLKLQVMKKYDTYWKFKEGVSAKIIKSKISREIKNTLTVIEVQINGAYLFKKLFSNSGSYIVGEKNNVSFIRWLDATTKDLDTLKKHLGKSSEHSLSTKVHLYLYNLDGLINGYKKGMEKISENPVQRGNWKFKLPGTTHGTWIFYWADWREYRSANQLIDEILEKIKFFT